ncbi:AAA family ATPase [Spirosoma sp. HMF3257]|uniref:Adenylate kinase n=1 Tax=Spirosoma telluris TaxID=2183553 RepID=A0A327NJF3_9BACT|nr:AAA family ATPase [Spirosoma telluris]RAI74156.1 adenylate kinase [Spirosoma telluris]
MKVHIFGASGSGVTTLGNALSNQISLSYFDTDYFFWEPSDPPFTVKRNPIERNNQLRSELRKHSNFIVGGSLVSWGDEWLSAFDLAVFLWIPPDIRLDRLRKREFARYGSVIYENEHRNRLFEEFIDWASGYDNPLSTRRSLVVHENWMQKLTCPILDLRGDYTVQERLDAVTKQLAAYRP